MTDVRAARPLAVSATDGGIIWRVKVRDLIHLLESTGWRLKRTKGSHRQFLHPQKKGMIVTVGSTG
jgi:predicted RNA binding protein YcfA (HicA-like mRNA interferase family)